MTIPEITNLLEEHKFSGADTALRELQRADRHNASVSYLLGMLREDCSHPEYPRESARSHSKDIKPISTAVTTRKLMMPTSVHKALILVAVSLGQALTAGAQDFDTDWPFYKPLTQTQRFGISPFYGYRFGGEVENSNTGATYSFEDSPAYGLFLDYAPKDYYGRYELLWSHQDSSLNFGGANGLGKVDVTIDVVQVGGELEFGKERFREYVSSHVGATHFSSDGYGDNTEFSLGIGGGVKAFLTKNIYLRADIRGFCNVTDGQGGFIYANGVTVAWFSGSTLWQGQASVGIGITF